MNLEQSDPGSYCLQQATCTQEHKQTRAADDRSRDRGEKG